MKEQIFNVGDKLLCKKDFFSKKIDISKGKEYEITDILAKIPVDEIFYYINDNNGSKIEILYNVQMNEFFCTKQDIRKLKLKQLNEGTDF